jgi:cobalt/nickel transport system permease protein
MRPDVHYHFLDPYRPAKSVLHTLDPRVKLILTVAFILAVALAPTAAWPLYILLLALAVAAAVAAELGVTYALKRALLALPFALAALPSLFTLPGARLFSFQIGQWALTATEPGLQRVLSVVLKSWISMQAAVLLTATTEFPDLLVAMRAIGVPRLLVAIFGLMWRYLFVLVDEAIRLIRARDARSGSPMGRGGGTVWWRARVTGGMAGNLFLRGYERSERIYAAMAARGYDGEVRTFPQPPLNTGQIIVLIGGLISLGALTLLGIWVW